MESLLNQYHLHLLNQKKESNTIKSYMHEADEFLRWCSRQTGGLDHLSQQTLVDYRDSLLAKGVKIATVNKSLSTLSTFFKWAQSIGLLNANYAWRMRIPYTAAKEAPRWLIPHEIYRLLDAASRESTLFQRVRNEALLHVMLFAGVRVDEVSQLPLDAVGDNVLNIYDDGSLIRTIPLLEATSLKLLAWLKVRTTTGKTVHTASNVLFVTERSGFMQPRAIQFVVEAYHDKLGIPVTSQVLRNTYCRMLVENGESVERVKQLAGHKSLLTTYKYFRIPAEAHHK